MQLKSNILHMIRRAIGVFALVAVLFVPAAALAAVPLHVPETTTTDTCAICHRAHTATTMVPYRTRESTITTGTSLILSTDRARGDVALCFNCHGVGSLGSSFDVETSFTLVSTHSIAPLTSPYGPSPKMCSSCHDSHGADRTPSGTPYPRLLRSFDGTTSVFSGEEFCAACHAARADERWDGLDVYARTGHFTSMPVPASGTAIRCGNCHQPHGSSIPPLLVGSVVPSAAPATATITANDRTFCLACHPDPRATWSGETTYAGSTHALSTTRVPITAKWVPAGTGRRVGECQVCHAPMGRSNGAGGTVAKLLEKSGRSLCDQCHAPGAAASTDTSSLAIPSIEATQLELVAAYRPSAETSWAARLSVYARDTTGTAPRALIGPREYRPAGRTGVMAAGDIDGDGAREVVVADAGEATLTIMQPDPLAGLSREPIAVGIPAGASARALVVANVVQTVPGWTDREEIVLVTTAGELFVYECNGSVLATVAGPLFVGATGPWGIASGDVTNTARADVVVTNRTTATMYVCTENSGSAVLNAHAVGADPVAPAIGELWASNPGSEIVVCSASGPEVSILTGEGANLSDYAVSAGVGLPVAVAVADVFSGSRDEVVVLFSDAATGDSSVAVVAQVGSGNGLDTATTVSASLGSAVRSGTLATGDIEGDGHVEIVVGNAGRWARDATAKAPSVQLLRENGAALSPTKTYPGGGIELAGTAPALAVVDLGQILPSRHPIDEVAVTHVSTETAPFARHVTCADCHDAHEATTSPAAAPAVQGALRGAWGVTGPSGAPARSATTYGVCYKCHSSFVALGGRRDVAAEFDPANASVHAVQSASTAATANPDSFVSGWSNTSVLYCSNCHGNDGRSGGQARGGHTSKSAPILAVPYLGVRSDDSGALCYSCHRFAVYGDSADTTGTSHFSDAAYAPRSLHFRHSGAPASGGLGFGCGSCHVTHGSATETHLMRSDVGFVATTTAPPANGGSCANDCHTGGASHSYAP
ncbi:MAG: cytochrome c3 family protein [Coriobacteriia bacterium]|nr:cytochrome c3 family protein [Coriobacteriia bacterium]